MIPPFLHDQARQAHRPNPLAQYRKPFSRHRHLALRVEFVDIEPQRQHQHLGAKVLHRSQRDLQLAHEVRFASPMRHRQVEVVPLPRTAATLVREPGHTRVEVGGVAMHRHIQHIPAVVEDFLNPLPVVHVGIEDGHAAVAAAQGLGSDSGVVEVAETTGRIEARMVAWRPAQGIGRRLAVENGLGTGYCALRRPIGRAPGVFAYRAAAVSQVAPGLGEDAAQGVGFTHEDVGHDLVAPVLGHFLPARMGLFEEGQVGLAMHCLERLEAGVLRLTDVEAQILGRLQQALGAFGDFLRGAHGAARVVAAWVVQQLFGVEVATHQTSPCSTRPARASTALSSTSAPWRASSGNTSSASLWLRPPTQGMNTMAVGQ
ncbi:hypothetical protein D3C78_525910 [compost metagenome]